MFIFGSSGREVEMSRRIAILGSTGSIGKSAVEVVRNLGSERVEVAALAACSNVDAIERQADEFHPELVALFDERAAKELKRRRPKLRVVAGMEGVIAAAEIASADLVLSAMVGTLGMIPTLKAIDAGKDIALANKEALVSGGALVMGRASERGVRILPVDSEHSALFQCLKGEEKGDVERLILTSSGGPFRNHTAERLAAVTVDEALTHPTWSMGAKVTVDSSTLMNKGLEVIEAHWLFSIPIEKIDVVIHPESVIHSMVEYIDGSMLAQMSPPTMLVPIQYALTYPERAPGLLKRFDFVKHSALHFYAPDLLRFRCLQLAFDAVREGGSMPCYMNAANEVLVGRFLKREISWIEISEKLDRLMGGYKKEPVEKIEDIVAVDEKARAHAMEL